MRPYYYLGNNLGLTSLSMGYKMVVDTQDLSLGAHVISDGFWAQHIDKFVSTVVKKGDKCLDLGCHMGYMTLLLHGLSGKPVDYVDMNFKYMDLTRKNLELNGLSGNGKTGAIVIIGDKRQVLVEVDPARSGAGHIFGEDVEGQVWNSNLGRVNTIHADTFGETKYDFVKMDLEGMDWYVMDRIDAPRAIIESRMEDARRYEGASFVHDSLENCMERVFGKYRVEIIQGDGTGRIVPTYSSLLTDEHHDLYLERR
jgi:hypothetical protein